MQDRPNAVELIDAVRHFLEDEMLPMQEDPRVRFRTRVAVNALAILQRELGAGSVPVEQESERLHALLPITPSPRGGSENYVRTLRRELARRIRSGEADRGPWRQAVLASTLASVQAKLVISNPKLVERHIERHA